MEGTFPLIELSFIQVPCCDFSYWIHNEHNSFKALQSARKTWPRVCQANYTDWHLTESDFTNTCTMAGNRRWKIIIWTICFYSKPLCLKVDRMQRSKNKHGSSYWLAFAGKLGWLAQTRRDNWCHEGESKTTKEGQRKQSSQTRESTCIETLEGRQGDWPYISFLKAKKSNNNGKQPKKRPVKARTEKSKEIHKQLSNIAN